MANYGAAAAARAAASELAFGNDNGAQWPIATPARSGAAARQRSFLLLQGPAGPFFRLLARQLEAGGARCVRAVLNSGDWVDSLGQRRAVFRGSFARWSGWVRELAAARSVTDLVLYGDCRPHHRAAIAVLRPLGVRVHVLEEGYLRPRWITYERDGVNGNSRLVGLALARIDDDQVAASAPGAAQDPGDAFWPHIQATFRYYACNFWGCFLFPAYRCHREEGLVSETLIWLRRLSTLRSAKRDARLRRKALLASGERFHLVLLQLAGDYQIRAHSPFASLVEFCEICIRAYAASGRREPLVFKNHPLDSGALDLARVIARLAEWYGVADRCVFIDGGKLARLLGQAISAVAINSTACHQTLERGIPTKILAKAVYNHSEFVAPGTLEEFFRNPQAPDRDAYKRFVKFLHVATQINGSFYTAHGMRMVLDKIVGRMLDPVNPIDVYLDGRGSLRLAAASNAVPWPAAETEPAACGAAEPGVAHATAAAAMAG